VPVGAGTRVASPTTLEELKASLRAGGDVALIGGGVGLMSAATPSRWAATNIDLARLGLEWIREDRAGAMLRLADLERSLGPGRRAVGESLRLTATLPLRRLMTIGGVLGARSPRADLAVALAVHGARVRVMDGAGGQVAWWPLLELWSLRGPFAILEVDLGAVGRSRFARFTGHHRAAPSLVSAAAMARPHAPPTICVGAAFAAPRLVDPDRLPPAEALAADPRASKHYRHEIMCGLVAQVRDEVEHD
jgi:CO/xanthine dehydrogenase FAD-binding subunit